MRVLLTIALILTVATGTALAANPDNFRDTDKVTPKKDGYIGEKAGLLDCSGAIEVTLDNIYNGNNTGAVNNVSTYGCSTWNESGGEVVYHLYLDTPTMWLATLTGDGCDLDLAVLDQCDEDLGCLIVADSGVETNVPVSGDFYFVVDGYNGAGCAFTLELTEVIPPPPSDVCGLIQDALGGGGSVFYGDTCDGQNLVTAEPCGTYTENGLEHYYEIFMPAGSSFTASVTNTADGALWLLDSCVGPWNCLAYADATFTGDTEVLNYTNAGGDTYVYFVVDSWGTETCGTYDMAFDSNTGAIAEEVMSLGSVKSTYR